MLNRNVARTRWAVLILAVIVAGACVAARSLKTSLADADKLYNEKSYADALKAYESLTADHAVPAERQDEVQYRIAVSLGKTQQWDLALSRSLEFVKAHRETVWEPRGLYWLGRLYLGVPHQGYRTGTVVHRGNDVPKQPAGDAAPERVDLSAQDGQNAHDALEAARVLFTNFRGKEDLREEEVQLDFDLARVLTESADVPLWASKGAWEKPDAPVWKIDTAQAYDPKWPAPKRIEYLYAEIPSLARPMRDRAHQSALALFGEALWLRLYHNIMQGYAVRYENGAQVRIPYPYETETPEGVLRSLVERYPDDPVREQAQYTIGLWLQQNGRYADAERELKSLIAARPDSKWVVDARRDLEQMSHAALSLYPVGLASADQKPKLQVGSRNIAKIQFRAYRIKMEDALQYAKAHNVPEYGLNQFEGLFADLNNLDQRYGRPAAEWTLDTKDTGLHESHNETITTPLTGAGAYLVEASGPSIKTGTLVLITDLAMTQQTHRDGSLFFVADAQTGAPVANSHVVAKQFWWEAGHQHSAFTDGETNALGLLTVPLLAAPGRSSYRMQAVAVTGSRVALTDGLYSNGYTDNPNLIQVYSTTDRNVYRPTQRVYYRELVMRHERGGIKPLTNASVHVDVRDPQGKSIYANDEMTSEFGSVKGEFDLSHNVPLGEYSVYVTVPKIERGGTQYGGNRFRVEEYKKPEFEVTVTPSADRVRLGEPATATVHAGYYFGGAVANAKVTYRVYRNYWYQNYRFPRPFDFLYRFSSGGDYNTYYRNGAVITQGEATTDAHGDAKVTFATKAAAGSGYENNDLSYAVDADVQDASRRVILGSGTVKATRHDVAAFLDFPHGYATQGDRVDIEVMTLNPSDRPVVASGKMRVYRQPSTPDRKETLVYEELLKTGVQGRGFFHWKDAPSGYFRIAFETRDTAEEPVIGQTYVWVDGTELRAGRFQFHSVGLFVENPYYEQDQTAKVLLVAPAPNSTVLLVRQANNEIIGKDVIHVAGQSMEIKVPLGAADVPNVYLTATCIRDGQVYMASQELFVPPVHQLAKVTVAPDKQQYRPGERAHLRIAALDWRGRPLRTELSVGVTDASLGYIQKDYAPDIRSYFYGDRRSQSVQATQSFSASFSARTEDSAANGQFATHEWVLPDGMGQLAEWPGVERQSWYYLNGYYHGFYNTRSAGGRGGFGGGGFAQYGRGSKGDDSFALDFAGAGPGGMPMGAAEAADAKKPMSSMSELRDENRAAQGGSLRKDASKREAGAGQDAPVRSHFADTAFWTPAVVTDAHGQATVDVTWPDNLTQWRAQAIGTTQSAQVGVGDATVRTKKDLIVRLQTPRFLVERDTVLLTANVQNYLTHAAKVRVRLDLEGGSAEIVAGNSERGRANSASSVLADRPEVWLDLPKDGEGRVDWAVHALRQGSMRIRMYAASVDASDATELTIPVIVHGVERATAQNGVLREQGEAKVTIALPKERKPGSSELVVSLNPSLATIMLDALPYLNGYPYGCVEQTMSRFLPSVVVAQTLKESGYDLEALGKRAKLLQERSVGKGGSKAVANSPYSYPSGRPGVLQTTHLARTGFSPVFDTAQLKSMTADGLARIQQMQHADGGWGWWPQDTSDPFMTAYVLYGLQVGKSAGYDVDGGMVDRGLKFLTARFLEDDNYHRMAYEARVIGMDARYRGQIRPMVTGRLYTNREKLSAYSKALLALALKEIGDGEKAGAMLRNLQTTARVDVQNGTASWDQSDRYWWRWYNDRVETNAVVLQAFLAIEPSSPIPAMLVKWLANNRRANIWNDTRQTAMAVYALADYARVTKELAPDYTLTVDYGNRIRREYVVNHDNALFFDNEFVVPDALLRTGDQALTITKRGRGACYYGAYTRYFSLEEPIAATSNEIAVTRRYYRLIPGTASGTAAYVPVSQDRPNPFLTGRYELLDQGGSWTAGTSGEDGPRYDRAALKDGDAVTSGDMIDVELQIESKNDYEYLAFEDLKPAGCEPVSLRSGGRMGLGVYSNIEFRDQKVAFFVAYMPQGERTLTYRLRAETPGQFHALPTNGYAMYAPDIRCLSAETRVGVKDAPPAAGLGGRTTTAAR